MTRARVTIAALAVMLLTACTGGSHNGLYKYPGATPKDQLVAVADRRLVGPVVGTLLAGGQYQLQQDRGKVVVLNFFASWCIPCGVETPQFETVYQEQKASGVQFVGLDIKDLRGPAKSFVAGKGVTYPVVYDEAAKSAIQLGDVPVSVIPETVIIDRHGRVAAVYLNVLLAPDLRNVLAQLAKEA